jgi:hypothetical protein
MYHTISLQLVDKYNNLITETGFNIMLNLTKNKSLVTLNFPEFQFTMPASGTTFITISGELPLEYRPRNNYVGHIQGIMENINDLIFIIQISTDGLISIEPVKNRIGNQTIYLFNANYISQ